MGTIRASSASLDWTIASLAGAVRWVTDNPYIASAAVAMANFSELEEHLSRH
jgi:hypothetical protein